MTDAAEIARIAEGLTEAQKRAVLNAQWVEERGVWSPAGRYLHADRRVRYRLCCHGIIRDYLRRSYPLTSFGLAVRAHLEANHDQTA